MLRKLIPAFIVIIALVTAGTMLSARSTRMHNEKAAGELVVECINNLMVIAKHHGALLEQYESRHQAIKYSLALFAEEKTDKDNPLSSVALQLCRDIGQVFIDIENQAVATVETVQSDRMKDPSTVKIESEYLWRIDALDKFTELVRELDNFDANRIDRVRKTMVASSLPKGSRVIISSHLISIPTDRSRSQIRANYTIRQYLEVERKLVEFLYTHRNDYRLADDGTPQFDSVELLKDFNILAYSARERRQKTSLLGGNQFFGMQPVVSAPITVPGSLSGDSSGEGEEDLGWASHS